MKIIYKQPYGSIFPCGIHNCCLKELHPERDKRIITKKVHRHSEFENHIITEGLQIYEIAGKEYTVKKENYIVIFPGTMHRCIFSAENTHKFACTFGAEINMENGGFCAETNPRIICNFETARKESLRGTDTAAYIAGNSIFENIIIILRAAGFCEEYKPADDCGNAVCELANQFIRDNIELSPTVYDTAEYCHMSAKQLTRIFVEFEGKTPGEYIKTQRIEKIKLLLNEGEFSLKEISEKTGFANEYYFNCFFKKYEGIPPGKYRKMVGK